MQKQKDRLTTGVALTTAALTTVGSLFYHYSELLLVISFLACQRVFGTKIAAMAGAGGALLLLYMGVEHHDPHTALLGSLAIYGLGVGATYLCLVDCLTPDGVVEQSDRERRLLESEGSLRFVIDTIPALVWCAHADGGPAFINKRMAEFVGTVPSPTVEPPVSATGPTRDSIERWRSMLHPDDYDAAYVVWHKALETGHSYRSFHRLRRFDGTYRLFHSMGEALRDEKGKVIYWYGINIDIDDAKRNEEALADTRDKLTRAMQSATIAELSASLAHEINQPLAAIVANGQACKRWLAAEPPNHKRIAVTVDRILRDCRATADIVTRVKALFRQNVATKIDVDLNELIHEVLKLVRDQARRRNVRVETLLIPDLPTVGADRVQIQQLLMNLILNAIEAMPNDGQSDNLLLIESSVESGTTALIRVCDTGCGIEDHERIFDAFYTTKQNGMGMGLAICRSIAEQHGGRLRAQPNGAQGTTFVFELPIGAALPAA